MEEIENYKKGIKEILSPLSEDDRQRVLDDIFFNQALTQADMRIIKEGRCYKQFTEKFTKLRQSQLLPGLVILDNETASFLG